MKDTIRAVEGNSGDPVCKLDNKSLMRINKTRSNFLILNSFHYFVGWSLWSLEAETNSLWRFEQTSHLPWPSPRLRILTSNDTWLRDGREATLELSCCETTVYSINSVILKEQKVLLERIKYIADYEFS